MASDYRGESSTDETGGTVSLIGPGMEVVGEIKCDGAVRIEGRVKGSIEIGER